jgi:cystathionine beta-synthase
MRNILQRKKKDIKVIGVDTYGSILKEFTKQENSLGNAYTYITEGIGEDILPENYDMSVIRSF